MLLMLPVMCFQVVWNPPLVYSFEEVAAWAIPKLVKLVAVAAEMLAAAVVVGILHKDIVELEPLFRVGAVAVDWV